MLQRFFGMGYEGDEYKAVQYVFVPEHDELDSHDDRNLQFFGQISSDTQEQIFEQKK